MKSFSFKVDKEDFRESGCPILVGFTGDDIQITDIMEELENIRLYDDYHNWFRPHGDVYGIEEGVVLGGELKFVSFKLKFREPFTVVFSKLIVHKDMKEFISRICFDIHSRFPEIVAAGFCRVTEDRISTYGESESIGINAKGDKIRGY